MVVGHHHFRTPPYIVSFREGKALGFCEDSPVGSARKEARAAFAEAESRAQAAEEMCLQKQKEVPIVFGWVFFWGWRGAVYIEGLDRD